MDKLFNSTFDFFSYAIPGSFVLFSFFVLDSNYASLPDYLAFFGSLSVGPGVLLLILGYLIGFALNPLGRYLYKSLGFKLFDSSIDDFRGPSISEKYALLRELSPSNFKYVETWNMLCTMAHNMALACGFMIVLGILRTTIAYSSFVLSLTVGAAMLFFFLLHRAVTFYVWAANDINATIRTLHLKDRADARGKSSN